MNIYNSLSPWFCKVNGIEKNTAFTIEYIEPQELLCPERLDLVVKYNYVEAYVKKKDMTYIKKIYKSLIEAFSEGRFVEPGQERKKRKIEDYYRVFNHLIDSIKIRGLKEEISAVPINENNIICNGSHRVAIALYFGYKVPCIRIHGINMLADYKFFETRLMPDKYLDYMVMQYSLLKKNTYAACIWPRGRKQLINNNLLRRAINEITQNRKLIAVKEADLSYRKLDQFIKMTYYPAPWLGKKELGFPGSKNKTDACYEKHEKLTLIIFEGDSLENIIQTKLKIRNYCNVGNHSIHISDNGKETSRIIKWFIKSYNYRNMVQWCKLLARLKRKLKFVKIGFGRLKG